MLNYWIQCLNTDALWIPPTDMLVLEISQKCFNSLYRCHGKAQSCCSFWHILTEFHEHLKEIQLRQWLNKCIQSWGKYFPTLLLTSWLTAERTGIANFIRWLKVLCLWTTQEIVPLFFSFYIPRALVWMEEGKGILVISLFLFSPYFSLFFHKHINMHYINDFALKKCIYIYLKPLKAVLPWWLSW